MEEILHAFGIDWKLISIQIFNFTILAVLLWYFLYTPVLNLLKERQEKIDRGLKDAEEAKEAKQSADREKQTVLAAAQKEAEAIHERGKKHADEKAKALVMSAEERAAQIVRDAEAKARTAKDEAVKASEAEIAKLAVLAAEKVLIKNES